MLMMLIMQSALLDLGAADRCGIVLSGLWSCSCGENEIFAGDTRFLGVYFDISCMNVDVGGMSCMNVNVGGNRMTEIRTEKKMSYEHNRFLQKRLKMSRIRHLE